MLYLKFKIFDIIYAIAITVYIHSCHLWAALKSLCQHGIAKMDFVDFCLFAFFLTPTPFLQGYYGFTHL